jgi:hypothetical protein
MTATAPEGPIRRRPQPHGALRSHIQIHGTVVDFEGELTAILPGGERMPVDLKFANLRVPGYFGGPVIEMDLDPVAHRVLEIPPQPQPRPTAPARHHDMRRRPR